MTERPEPSEPHPWRPMSDPVDVMHLAKLAEEVCECGSALARCLMQGIDERHPMSGKLNREWLEDEIADVIANIELVVTRFDLKTDRIAARCAGKMVQLRAWHATATVKAVDRILNEDHGRR